MIDATIATDILTGVALLGAGFSFAMLWRNNQVFRYRMALLDQIDKVNNEEISAGDYESWRERFRWFKTVSYNYMMLCFWRPLDSFYPDRAEMMKPRMGPTQEAVLWKMGRVGKQS